MTTELVKPPYPLFSDANGEELNNGYIYIGTAGSDPESNPITVYWDSAKTTPAAQPLRTLNGLIVRGNSPAKVWAGSDYSIKVKDKSNVVVRSSLSENADTGIIDGSQIVGLVSSQIIHSQGSAGAVDQTVEARLRISVSITDFHANGVDGPAVDPSGALDSIIGIQAAYNSGAHEVHWPDGEFKTTAMLTVPRHVRTRGTSTMQDTANGSRLKVVGAITAVYLANANCIWDGVSLNGTSITSGSIGFIIGRPAQFVSYNTLKNMGIRYMDRAIDFDNSFFCALEDVYVGNCTKGIQIMPTAGTGFGFHTTLSFDNVVVENCVQRGIHEDSPLTSNTMRWGKVNVQQCGSSQAITAASQANPCNIEVVGHVFATGDEIRVNQMAVGGMVELNGITHTVTVVDVDNVTLDGVNSTGYAAYTTGGTAGFPQIELGAMQSFNIGTLYIESSDTIKPDALVTTTGDIEELWINGYGVGVDGGASSCNLVLNNGKFVSGVKSVYTNGGSLANITMRRCSFDNAPDITAIREIYEQCEGTLPTDIEEQSIELAGTKPLWGIGGNPNSKIRNIQFFEWTENIAVNAGTTVVGIVQLGNMANSLAVSTPSASLPDGVAFYTKRHSDTQFRNVYVNESGSNQTVTNTFITVVTQFAT